MLEGSAAQSSGRFELTENPNSEDISERNAVTYPETIAIGVKSGDSSVNIQAVGKIAICTIGAVLVAIAFSLPLWFKQTQQTSPTTAVVEQLQEK